MKRSGGVLPTDASAQRLRVGAELRRLREAAGLSGEQVARVLGWSQPKVSRIEMGRTAFTVKDVAQLLALYGVAEDDVRAELLGATAGDTGETAWIVRAGAYPRRQASVAALESVTKRIRQYQPVLVPGLLQTREYAWHVAKACGALDPDMIADGRMRRQQILARKDGPRYEVVLDARALLLRAGPVESLREQAEALAKAGERRKVDLRIIPIGALSPIISTVGFTIYEFQADDSPPVVWVESLAGDTYYSDPDDVRLYTTAFEGMRKFALSARESADYLSSLAKDIERYLAESEGGREEMRRPNLGNAKWRKSSVSGDGGCVEVAYGDGVVGVRDSKDHRAGPVLVFSEHEWSAFLEGARSGEFDLGTLRG
jgi:transcriptional regulator with XRE-family HTH domain